MFSYHRCNTLVQIEQYHHHQTKGCVLHLCSLAFSRVCVCARVICFGVCTRLAFHRDQIECFQRSGREKAAPPPPPSIRGRSGAKGNRATVMLRESVVVLARDQTGARLFISSSGERVIRTLTGLLLAAELISGPFLRRLTHCARVLFLVTQEMFSSQSPPPNRAKQLTELIKFSPAT
jgi:hypothetical protein